MSAAEGTLVGQPLPVAVQAATGRGYLRGAVTLAEHAATLLDRLPADEIAIVPEHVARIERSLAAIKRQCGMPEAPAGTFEQSRDRTTQTGLF